MPQNVEAVNRSLESPRSFLRGFGQIMLQESAATGLIFLAALFANSRSTAIGAVLGAAAGVVGARLLRCDATDVKRGWYGFNGALVGIALLFFHEPGMLPFLLVVAGGVLSTILMRGMLGWAGRFPPYTAPFIVTVWLMLPIAHAIGMAPEPSTTSFTNDSAFLVVMRGVGQVMFQEHWVTGVLFVIGIAVSSLRCAAWALIGSASGMVAARALGYPPDLIAVGSFGFNASLAAIAVSIRFRNNAFAVFSGIVLSVIMTRAFQLTFVPSLTAPFVLASWLVIAAGEFRHKRAEPA